MVSGDSIRKLFPHATKFIRTLLRATTAAAARTVLGCATLDAKTTVASATTPDIFATTVGSLVDYTGTATCTGFVAAPQAGVKRTLICADACKFTAGANLLIEGIQSGHTITLAANAKVEVVAITTTQFKMTYSVSGSFTATGTGFATPPTATWYYTVINGIVSLTIKTISGTSNSVNFTVTGIPAQIQILSANGRGNFGLAGKDNSVDTDQIMLLMGQASGTATLYLGPTGSSWTSSGTKTLAGCAFLAEQTITYTISS